MYGQTLIERGSTGTIPSVPFELPKNLFRYGEQSLWSTQMVQGAGAPVALANGNFRLFTTPLGQVGQGFANALTIGETNIKEGGRIPSGIAYDVFGVSCNIGICVAVGDSNIGAAIDTPAEINYITNAQANAVLTWDFTQTQVDIAPVNLIGAGGGVFGSIAVSSAAGVLNSGYMNNGAGSVWLYRKHPVALPGNSTFSILCRYGSRAQPIPAAGGSLVIRVCLLGYYKNVIEIG